MEVNLAGHTDSLQKRTKRIGEETKQQVKQVPKKPEAEIPITKELVAITVNNPNPRDVTSQATGGTNVTTIASSTGPIMNPVIGGTNSILRTTHLDTFAA